MGKRVSGFTLIEMAIVLIIIGIILTSVVKGRTLITSAEGKKATLTFIQQWKNIANMYHDKTGQLLGDGYRNGGRAYFADQKKHYMEARADNATQVMELLNRPDTRMDNIWLHRTDQEYNDQASNMLHALYNGGIAACSAFRSNLTDMNYNEQISCSKGYNIFESTFNGAEANGARVGVGVAHVAIHNGPIKNVLFFVNVPRDLAVGIDREIDGLADGLAGECLLVNSYAEELTGTADNDSILVSDTERVIPVELMDFTTLKDTDHYVTLVLDAAF
jgi:prepilin-type N-terminal cleavage/methylation domain-containing protein